jgi:DNA-binding FrmR family transcriptional regulator
MLPRESATAPGVISEAGGIALLDGIPPHGMLKGMGHTGRNKEKLLNRIRRIRGQLNAVEAGIESEADCATVLQTLVACCGALNAMVVEMFEDHVRFYIVDPKITPHRRPSRGRARNDRSLEDMSVALCRSSTIGST